MPVSERRPATGGRPRAVRILIVGCGDVGLRVARLASPFARVVGVVRDPEQLPHLRAAGIVPLVADLDDPLSLHRLAMGAAWVVHLVPPQAKGNDDHRTRRLIAALGRVERLVYVSTSGVYGDCGGARINEARALKPETDRARRRASAERQLRTWARRGGVRLSILRAPGIYARERLPIARVEAGTPVLMPEEDVYTNHVHADDLARMVVAALMRAPSSRSYNACDSAELTMGEYFDCVADAMGLARPPRASRAVLAATASAASYSFMRESRRLSNARLLSELGVRLRYPRVDSTLARWGAHPEN